MRLLHIADLHLGKRFNAFSLLDDQAYLIKKICELLQANNVDVLLLAGDVYDQSVPPAEATRLLDRFLTDVAALGVVVLVISGNHDSGERLAFGSKILSRQGVYIAGAAECPLPQVRLTVGDVPVCFTLLPFVRAAHVRRLFPDRVIASTEDAVRALLDATPLPNGYRQVLLAHQFVAGGSTDPEFSDSERLQIGGTDLVDWRLFQTFDYVALGHLHRPQSVGCDQIRYAGSLLKYSFSECSHEKSAVLVELAHDGDPTITLMPLVPERDVREVRLNLGERLRQATPVTVVSDDYVKLILEDETPLVQAM